MTLTLSGVLARARFVWRRSERSVDKLNNTTTRRDTMSWSIHLLPNVASKSPDMLEFNASDPVRFNVSDPSRTPCPEGP